MNNLSTITKMTSMQIAEVTGKQHAHIMRDIRDEIEKLEVGGVSIESKFGLVEYTDAKGEKRPCYTLTKEGVLQLAARYDAVVRAKLIEMVMAKVPQEQITSVKKQEIEARYNNSLARKANILLKIASNPSLNETYRQVLQSQASAIITGQAILPLPEAGEKTYSAQEIGEKLGISSTMVGRIANANNLKTNEYGKLFHDKSRHSNKEVETFRYYESVIPELQKLIGN
jgi:Rha family phage regulatory protein